MPHTERIIRTCILGDGLQARLSDLTSHYFGGYYHVRIQFRADIPVSAGVFADASEYRDAVQRLGAVVTFSRTLEKMAVPDSEIDTVRQQLLADFETNVLPYLVRDDFSGSFVRSEYRKARKSGMAVHRYQS